MSGLRDTGYGPRTEQQPRMIPREKYGRCRKCLRDISINPTARRLRQHRTLRGEICAGSGLQTWDKAAL